MVERRTLQKMETFVIIFFDLREAYDTVHHHGAMPQALHALWGGIVDGGDTSCPE